MLFAYQDVTDNVPIIVQKVQYIPWAMVISCSPITSLRCEDCWRHKNNREIPHWIFYVVPGNQRLFLVVKIFQIGKIIFHTSTLKTKNDLSDDFDRKAETSTSKDLWKTINILWAFMASQNSRFNLNNNFVKRKFFENHKIYQGICCERSWPINWLQVHFLAAPSKLLENSITTQKVFGGVFWLYFVRQTHHISIYRTNTCTRFYW